MRYLFRGLIRETGKTVEGAVEADTPEDALNALSANGIVTEDLTPAPAPVLPPPSMAGMTPRTAGRAGAPPMPPGMAAAQMSPTVPAEQAVHPDANSADPLDRAFAAASQAVSFDAVAQRYRGKSVWVIDRDKIRRQVAVVVDEALKRADREKEDADRTRERVAEAIKEVFKDNRNIASQQTPEQARAAQNGGAAATTAAVPTPELEALLDRLGGMITKAETVLTQLQVAARRVGSGGGGGGGGGFASRRAAHIPRARGEEQNSVLMEIFKANVALGEQIAKTGGLVAEAQRKGQAPAPSPAPADGNQGE